MSIALIPWRSLSAFWAPQIVTCEIPMGDSWEVQTVADYSPDRKAITHDGNSLILRGSVIRFVSGEWVSAGGLVEAGCGVLHHSVAMDLLQKGVHRSLIALWLGHESVESTEMYLHASMAMKEKALAKATSSKTRNGRYRPNDRLLAFLKSL